MNLHVQVSEVVRCCRGYVADAAARLGVGSAPASLCATNGTLEMLTISAARAARGSTDGRHRRPWIGGWGQPRPGRGRPAYPETVTNSLAQSISSPVKWALKRPITSSSLVDSASRLVEVQPHGRILIVTPTGPDTELEAPVRASRARRLLCEHGGDVVVDAEDAAPDAQGLGHRRRVAIAAMGARSCLGVRAARCAGPGPR